VAYVDLNLEQVLSDFDQDLGSDINFIVDAERAHIAVTAAFPSITVAGNVANTIHLKNSTVYSIVEKSPEFVF
jgi:hypothetical protein